MPKPLDRYALFYPMRFVASSFLILLVILYVRAFYSLGILHVALISTLLVHPHFYLYLARKHAHDRAKVEQRAFLVDSLLLGCVVYVTSYTLLPSLILITVSLANALAVSGPRQLLLSAIALAIGATLPLLIAGSDFVPRATQGINITCSVFLLVYFLAFAFSSHNRNLLLLRAQEAAREQKNVVEIEKARSDQLVLSLVPKALSEEFASARRLEPRAFDSIVLLAVEFPELGRALESEDPAELLDHLSHCFRACDAIVMRHGLEPLRTVDALYVAIAGVPTKGDGDVRAGIEAALEIRDFASDQALGRESHGRAPLKPRIGLHCGRVHCGLMATEKLTFDVWGSVAEDALIVTRGADPGQVVVSREILDSSSNGFVAESAGTVTSVTGEAISLYSIGGPKE